MRRHVLYATLAASLASACVSTVGPSPGPAAERAWDASPRGWLLLVGGGGTTDAMYARAIALGGGGSSTVAVFPQASDLPDTGERSAAAWRERGAGEVRVGDPGEVSDALRLLEWASIIWFPGGAQSRLVDALGAELPAAIQRRYRDGAVVGGTSAGAAVMSAVMITGQIAGVDQDEDGLGIVRAHTVETTRGLGLVEWAVLDQHFVRRGRFNRLLSCVLDHPELVGVGIDERTAILVQGRRFEVLGESQVMVIDGRRAPPAPRLPGQRSAATGLRLSVLVWGMSYDAFD